MPIASRHVQASPRSPIVREFRRDSPGSPNVTHPTSKSWHNPAIANSASPKHVVSFSSAGHRSRRPTFSQVVSSGLQNDEKKRIVAEMVPQMKLQRYEFCLLYDVPPNTYCRSSRSMFRLQPKMRQQLHAHIWVYADMLLAWQLPQKRAELLKAASGEMFTNPILPAVLDLLNSSPIGMYLLR